MVKRRTKMRRKQKEDRNRPYRQDQTRKRKGQGHLYAPELSTGRISIAKERQNKREFNKLLIGALEGKGTYEKQYNKAANMIEFREDHPKEFKKMFNVLYGKTVPTNVIQIMGSKVIAEEFVELSAKNREKAEEFLKEVCIRPDKRHLKRFIKELRE